MVPRKAPEGSRITCETERSLLPSTEASMLPDSKGLSEPSRGCDSHATSRSVTSTTPTSLPIAAILDRRPRRLKPMFNGFGRSSIVTFSLHQSVEGRRRLPELALKREGASSEAPVHLRCRAGAPQRRRSASVGSSRVGLDAGTLTGRPARHDREDQSPSRSTRTTASPRLPVGSPRTQHPVNAREDRSLPRARDWRNAAAYGERGRTLRGRAGTLPRHRDPTQTPPPT